MIEDTNLTSCTKYLSQVEDKIKAIRKEMESKKATLSVFSALDDVVYLFNVRAMGDVDTCPVGIAYATVSNDQVTLYCDSRKVESESVQDHLKEITIKPYDDIVKDIQTHCETKGNKVWVDTSRANYAISSVIPKNALVDNQNAVTPMKACKNEAELEGMHNLDDVFENLVHLHSYSRITVTCLFFAKV